MARCGCDKKCTCVFEEGVCTKIDITATPGADCGNPTLSYAVSVKTDGETVVCGPNGLSAVFTHQDTNTVDLEGLGTAGSPLEAHVIRTADGSVPDTSGSGLGNLIKELPGVGGGIYVSCEDVQDCVGAAIDAVTTDCLEYDDATNTISILICAEPNGIECAPAGGACPTGGLLVAPSSDANNSLTFGTDGRLFAPAAAIIPGECMQFTGTGTQADPFVVSPLVAGEPNGIECVPGQGLAVIPSSDVGNNLTFGGDQRLFINRCPFTNGGDQLLFGNTGPCFEFTGGTDCVTPMVATFRISDDICQGIQCRPDGLFIQVNPTDLPPNPEITVNFGPAGPFNGVIPVDTTFIVPLTCITITNNSPCTFMISSGILTGFVDLGRTTGSWRVAFDIEQGDGTGTPPFFAVSQMGAGAAIVPNPANRQILNAVWSGDDFGVAAGGGTRTLCTRVQVNATNPARPVVNGQVFSGQLTLTLVGRWNV